MRIYFSRHGESEANLLHEHANRGFKYGLTEAGRAQAAALAARLEDVPIARIYSSPLKRAVETAEIVARAKDTPIEIAAALCEYDCGVLEGRSDQAAWKQHLAVYHQWVDEGLFDQCIEGGESYLDMQARFVPFIEALVAKHQGSLDRYRDTPANVLLIAHGSLYRLMLSLVLSNVELAYSASHPVGYAQLVVAETRPEGLVALEWCGESMEA
jgi:broad specificity phosphatase PhoE